MITKETQRSASTEVKDDSITKTVTTVEEHEWATQIVFWRGDDDGEIHLWTGPAPSKTWPSPGGMGGQSIRLTDAEVWELIAKLKAILRKSE